LVCHARRPDEVNDFCRALRAKLFGGDKGFAKRYLRLLVAAVRFTAKEMLLKRSHSPLAHAVVHSGALATAGAPRSRIGIKEKHDEGTAVR
jgi:site-specific DNA recombinase